ncbi:ABC-type sugar transport system, permease component [Clostridium cylindrosporum DSM 605]|uniref:ABC-type sugar transport system, permease component n=2 Tax=Clostridium cylindrosporum TaxID=1495 RepID=A0A0J8G319_CLOCY|nr:ABC-type sugar transport system, permease component [Clostridium cylindrosporum DSM 605]
MYILPIGIILFSFYIIPMIMSMVFGFTKYNIMSPAEFIGLENYKGLLTDTMFKDSLKNTLIFSLVSVPFQTIIALIFAVWLTSKESKFYNFVKGVIFIPVISSMLLISVIWKVFLNLQTSPINMIFNIFGATPPNWLGNPSIVLFTLIAINIWKNIGYFVVIYVSAIMDVDRNVYEAAKLDGVNKLQEFKDITLPLLKPTTIMVVFLGVIWSFQTFDLIYNLTGGGPGTRTMTLVLNIYNLSFKDFNAGYAMSVANVLLFIIATVSILQKTLLKRDKSTIY